MLGQMIQAAGADHILWGTDSIWNGSPQSQIERLRRLKMPDELMEKYEYPELTDEIKDQILGLNAAKLFGIDAKAKRQGDQGRQADACCARSTARTRRRATRSTAGSGSTTAATRPCRWGRNGCEWGSDCHLARATPPLANDCFSRVSRVRLPTKHTSGGNLGKVRMS